MVLPQMGVAIPPITLTMMLAKRRINQMRCLVPVDNRTSSRQNAIAMNIWQTLELLSGIKSGGSPAYNSHGTGSSFMSQTHQEALRSLAQNARQTNNCWPREEAEKAKGAAEQNKPKVEKLTVKRRKCLWKDKKQSSSGSRRLPRPDEPDLLHCT